MEICQNCIGCMCPWMCSRWFWVLLMYTCLCTCFAAYRICFGYHHAFLHAGQLSTYLSHALPVYQMMYACLFGRINDFTSLDPKVYFSSRGSGNCTYSQKAWETNQITAKCQNFNTISFKFNQDAAFHGQVIKVFLSADVLPNITSVPLAIATGGGQASCPCLIRSSLLLFVVSAHMLFIKQWVLNRIFIIIIVIIIIMIINDIFIVSSCSSNCCSSCSSNAVAVVIAVVVAVVGSSYSSSNCCISCSSRLFFFFFFFLSTMCQFLHASTTLPIVFNNSTFDQAAFFNL